VDVNSNIPYALTNTNVYKAPSTGATVFISSGLTSVIDCSATSVLFPLPIIHF
jgi:hypothetical protein